MAPRSGRKRAQVKDEVLLAQRREAILAAATTVFAQHGYSDTDVQLIADAIPSGKGTIYLYFRSKEELFLAAVDRSMRLLHEQILAAAAAVTDPLDRMERVIRAYFTFFRDNPDFAELLIQERAGFRTRTKPTYFVHREANVKEWHATFRTLIAEGRVRDVPVERILDVIGDLLYGTMFADYFTGRHKPIDAQVEDILDIVFNGILTASERSRYATKAHSLQSSKSL